MQRITSVGGATARNLQITACYARLSDAMAQRIGPCASWCTFATWASRQAGSTIRGEDLLARLKRHLGVRARVLAPVESTWRALVRKGVFEPQTRLGRVIRAIHSPFDAFERASDAVARGNRKVFEEIGLVFARYLASVPVDATPESPEWRAFESSLRDGDPPAGQRLLRQAFARYQRATAEPDRGRRAQVLLLANLEIGLHEQTRLQPDIVDALDAPLVTIHDLGRRVLAVLCPPLLRAPRALRAPAEWLVELPARPLHRFAVRVTREAITDSLMVLTLPGGTALALGRRLDAPWPDALRTVDDEALVAFLQDLACSGQASDHCGARNWGELRERVHYIAHLFRAFHDAQPLRQPPFTAAQLRAIDDGEVPVGSL